MRGATPAHWRLPARQCHRLENALVPEFRLPINLLRLRGFLLAGGLLFVLTHSNSALRWRAAGALASNLLDFPAVYNNLSWLGYVLLPGKGDTANTLEQLSSRKGCHSGGHAVEPFRKAADSAAASPVRNLQAQKSQSPG